MSRPVNCRLRVVAAGLVLERRAAAEASVARQGGSGRARCCLSELPCLAALNRLGAVGSEALAVYWPGCETVCHASAAALAVLAACCQCSTSWLASLVVLAASFGVGQRGIVLYRCPVLSAGSCL